MALGAVALEQLVLILVLGQLGVTVCHLLSQVLPLFAVVVVVVAIPLVSFPLLAALAEVALVAAISAQHQALQTQAAAVVAAADMWEAQAVRALLLYHRLLQRHQPQALQRFHL
jgi:hypothetical protein